MAKKKLDLGFISLSFKNDNNSCNHSCYGPCDGCHSPKPDSCYGGCVACDFEPNKK